MKYYRRSLALRRIIFCIIYTLFIGILIFYCGDRYSITTSNITNVKSIESNRLKPRIINENIHNGKIQYTYKTIPYEVNCLIKEKIKDDKYNDSVYGEVLILETSNNFLCGSILKISNDKEEMYGIVLDKDDKQSKDLIKVLTIYNKEDNFEDINYSVERYGN